MLAFASLEGVQQLTRRIVCPCVLAILCVAASTVAAERTVADIEKDLRELSQSEKEKREPFVATVKEMLQRKQPQFGVVYQLVQGKLVGPPDAEEQEKKLRAEWEEFQRVKDLCLSMVAKYKVTEVIELLVNDISYDGRAWPPLGAWFYDPSLCVRTLIALGKPASQAVIKRLKNCESIDTDGAFQINEKGEIVYDDKAIPRFMVSLYLTTLMGIEKIDGTRRLLEDDADGKLAKVRKFAVESIFPFGEITLEKNKE